MIDSSPTVLVVGAGPVGMAGALELSRLGANVRLIEKTAERSRLSKAVGINARSLELLEPTGAADKLISRGLKIATIKMHYESDVLTAIDFSKMQHRFNFMLSLPQDETEDILESVLREQGVGIERNVELTGIEQSGSSVSATLHRVGGDAEYLADYVLGADGSHSTVRSEMGADFDGEQYEDTWSLADIRMSWPFGHGGGHLMMRKDNKVLFVLSMPGERYRIVSNHGEALELLPAGSKVGEILWQTTFGVGLRQVADYRKGRVFLAGDSAHIHSPAGGRGMNLGIEDATVFARRLFDQALDGYSASRFSIGAQVVKESNLQFQVASTSNTLLKTGRNWMIRYALGTELIQRPFRLRMAGLDHAAD